MTRPLIKSRRPKAIRYDIGTPQEQVVAQQPEVTYLELALDRIGWWLSEHRPFVRELAYWEKVAPPIQYEGSGFYMSTPGAHRIRWIWRGKQVFSLFYGNRTKGGKVLEFQDDRKTPKWF
jgi:hypothetical protein